MFSKLVQAALRAHQEQIPEWTDSTLALVEGDALEALAWLPPACADLVFCDPPYLLSRGGTTCSSGKRIAVGKGAWDEGRGGVDAEHSWHRRWLALCQRLLKPTGTIWISGTQHVLFSIGFAAQTLGFHVLNLITWQKPNPPPNLGCRCFTHSTEMVLWAAPHAYEPLRHVFNYDEAKADNDGKQMKDVWTIAAPAPMEKRFGKHPTQKPEELLDRIIRASSHPDQLVVDPFCGSGTTGVVARRLGRDFIGIESSSEYIDLAARRLSAKEPEHASPV